MTAIESHSDLPGPTIVYLSAADTSEGLKLVVFLASFGISRVDGQVHGCLEPA
jgi:hypothetical protein